MPLPPATIPKHRLYQRAKKGPKYPEPIQLGPSVPSLPPNPSINNQISNFQISKVQATTDFLTHRNIIAQPTSTHISSSSTSTLTHYHQHHPSITLLAGQSRATNCHCKHRHSPQQVAPSASTLHEHPVVSCEPVIHRLSAFTATLFFRSGYSIRPTTHNPQPSPDPYLTATYLRNMRIAVRHL